MGVVINNSCLNGLGVTWSCFYKYYKLAYHSRSKIYICVSINLSKCMTPRMIGKNCSTDPALSTETPYLYLKLADAWGITNLTESISEKNPLTRTCTAPEPDKVLN